MERSWSCGKSVSPGARVSACVAPRADERDHDRRAGSRAVLDADEELLCRIAERDREAFEILYRRYARAVYGLALRRLDDPARAEDATRRAFASMWSSAVSYVSERGDGARWVYTVARTAIPDPRSAPAADNGWQAFRVHAAVAALPEQEREALELTYWGGREPSEIAELLGLPVATVEAHTRSALAHLASQLEGIA